MMLELLLYIGLLVIGFYIILKAADYFVDESAIIGHQLGMSKLLIGLTIVAIGTSLPELFTSIASIFFTTEYSDFIIGTVMGSNITNILLIFGIFMLFSKQFEIHKRENLNIIMLLFTTIFFTTFIILGFVNYFAIILLIIYIVYLIYLSIFEKRELLEKEDAIVEINKKSTFKAIAILSASFIGLLVGSKLVIMSIESLGDLLSIPAGYLTLTTVAFATSLPEIAVTIVAARKKQYLLAIGNIVGSNICNICLVFGISGFVGYYSVQTSIYLTSIIFLYLSTLLFSALLYRKKFSWYFGHLFMLLYIIYIGTFFF